MKRKLVYNRWKIPSKEIRKKQDFNTLLRRAQKEPTFYWKSIRFWGTVATSAVALFLLISFL